MNRWVEFETYELKDILRWYSITKQDYGVWASEDKLAQELLDELNFRERKPKESIEDE